MLGTKFYKNNLNNKEYAECAIWCNANNATIEDKGEYYECVAIPAPTLEELKAQKLTELKATRDNEEVKPISYQGYRFDYDNKARDRISAAIIALDVSKGQIAWTTADNTEVMVNADDLRGVVANVAVRSNQLHVKYRKLKEQVEVCTTKEALEKIVWE